MPHAQEALLDSDSYFHNYDGLDVTRPMLYAFFRHRRAGPPAQYRAGGPVVWAGRNGMLALISVHMLLVLCGDYQAHSNAVRHL